MVARDGDRIHVVHGKVGRGQSADGDVDDGDDGEVGEEEW